MTRVALAARFARRELRSGLSGFRIFLLSLILGVAAIAAVTSLSDAFLAGLSSQGRVLLGGDVSVHLVHREATPAEHAFLARYGRVSEITSMRAMAYALHGNHEGARQLVELKEVDNAYPLYGSVGLNPAQPLAQALACDAQLCGAVVEQSLLDRLQLRRGGLLRIGTQNFRVSAVLTDEPDRLSGGFSLGPHVLISRAALARTGLVILGSLIEYEYRIAAGPRFSPRDFRAAAAHAFPDGGWEIRDRRDAAPGTRGFIEQVTMFLTLVGLTALAVGGVGAGQAIAAFIERKREEIATLKSLGAEGGLIFGIFFFQVMAIAALAVIVGVIIGAAVPIAFGALFGSELPVPAHFTLYPGALALAACFGLLSAAAFGIPPLARAQAIAPASLFRDAVARSKIRARWPYLAAASAAALIAIALALVLAPEPLFALEFLGGIVAGLVVLRLVSGGLRFALHRLPQPRRPALRLALSNLSGPASQSGNVVTALGLGLTLLATVTLLQTTVAAQVNGDLPATAPSFFFIDIQPADTAAFDATVKHFPISDYRRTPMIRGRITALKGVRARDAKVASDARWVLNGDRGITYAATPPKGTLITAGKWWAADYRGQTLVSFDAELADGLGLKLGDRLTLNVLGRELPVRIANFRDVDFSNGRQNFVMILSPGIIDRAPHSFLATLRVAPKDEEPLYRAVTDRFPGISVVRVKDAIAAINGLLQELSLGVRAASLVTVLAGLLVLAGAIAGSARARLYDFTILKVLGATRDQIAFVTALEFALLGFVTGVLALGAGTLAAWAICRFVFQVPMVFATGPALLTVVGGAVATLAFGLIGNWSALRARPAAQLRDA